MHDAALHMLPFGFWDLELALHVCFSDSGMRLLS
jgi:hypothetical protein